MGIFWKLQQQKNYSEDENFKRNECHEELDRFWKLQKEGKKIIPRMIISRETGGKWAYLKNCKKKERKLSCGWEFREKRDWFSTSDFPLEPPFVTVADAKFKSSLNFIQCPSSSSRKNNFNLDFRLSTVADAKSLKAL